MPKISLEDSGSLNGVLSVTIEKSDYEKELKDKFNEYRRESSFKGFRKGKVPLGFIKKMYGKPLLADMVNKRLEKELTNYFIEEKPDFLGQPIPLEEQSSIEFDINSLEDYEFRFDVGLAPQFELAGLEDAPGFEKLKAEIPEEAVTKELDQARKRLGESSSVEENFESGDLLTIRATELEGGELKPEGYEAEFKMAFETLTDEVLEKIQGLKVGDTFPFNIYNVEKNMTREDVQKYLLQFEEEEDYSHVGEEFQGLISEASRQVPMELGQDFFDRYFGEVEVTSEEEARKILEDHIRGQYLPQANTLLFENIKDYLLEKNELSLPDDFLKRWIKLSDESATDKMIEEQYPSFSRGTRWSMIQAKLKEKYGIEVTREELKEEQGKMYQRYFGNQPIPESTMDYLFEEFLKNSEQVQSLRNSLTTDKLLEQFSESFNIDEKMVSIEELEKEFEILKEKFSVKSEEEE